MIDPGKHLPQARYLQESCTKEDAVALMLGWIQCYPCQKDSQITEYGLSEDQLLFLRSVQGSMQERLVALRAAAYQDFLVAEEANAPVDVRDEKNREVIRCEGLIKKAGGYLMDFTEEIASGEATLLRIDPEATKHSGNVHYTVRSVEKWAQEKHEISIFDPEVSPPVTAITSAHQPENESEQEGGLSKTSAKNLQITFALLVEAFSMTAPKYHKGDDVPNVKAIAEHLEFLSKTAPKLRKGDDVTNVDAIAQYLELLSKTDPKADPMSGQDWQTIKKRIANAMKVKKNPK